jgi:hypothetical protein
VELNCITPTGIQKLLLKGVRFVPGAGVNLVSLTKIMDKGAQVKGAGKEIKLLLNGKVVLQALNVENMLIVQEENKGRTFAVNQRESAVLWHNRFRHAGYDALAKMAQKNLVEGLTVNAEGFKKQKDNMCEPCVLGK